MSKQNTPFRYDFVGSFLRPAELKQARLDFQAGKIGADALKAAEDDAICALVAKQKAAGYHVITDGEFRRATWHLDIMWGFCGVGHSRTEKGLPFLLASLAKLRRKTDKPFVCFIAGDGEEFDDFAVMSTNSGMSDCVIQLGFRRDSDRMLKASDLYLNTSSKNEAMSFAILEAMNAGVPLVVTDVGGNRDLAETHTVCGRVLKFGDSDGFSDAMLELMENDALRAEYSANALKKVSEEFDLRKLALDVFETYK